MDKQQTPFFFLFFIGGEGTGFDALPVIGRYQYIAEKVVQAVRAFFQRVDTPFV
ncbi:MAG: hypothetical protein V8T12_12715 [Parabacteroides johnsonii]